MPRFLAVDWDDVELRYMLGAVQKENLTVLKTGVASLDGDSEPASVLRNVVKEERIEPCHALLCLGRNQVEQLYLTLPPCSQSEIPILLRNQLLRELPGFAEQDPVDYLELDGEPDGEHKIIAATLTLLQRQSLLRAFRSIGRQPDKIGLRSVLAAEMIVHAGLAPETPALSVCAVGNDVDLAVFENGRIASIRSFRLPENLRLPEVRARIASEIQRTVTVGVDDGSGSTIKQVFLFGDDDWTPLVETLNTQGLNVQLVNPFTMEHVAAKEIPELPGRFAPLVALLLSEAPHRQTTIDFLHPKEPPRPANYVLAAILMLLLLGVVGYGLFYWNQQVVHGLEQEVANLEKEYQETATQLQQVQPIWAVLNGAKNWDAQGANWLDELRELSVVLPAEKDLVVTQMSFAISTDRRYSGSVQLSGMVRDPSVLMQLQNSLRAKGLYLMYYPQPTPNPAGGGYPWLFRTTIWRIKR